MRNPYRIPPWKTAPFFRLLLPFIAGILLQWYFNIELSYIVICITCFSVAVLLINFLPIAVRYILRLCSGILIHLQIAGIAMLITWYNDPRHQSGWYGNNYDGKSFMIIRINEPLIVKANSYKATGIVEAVVNDHHSIQTNGKILIYFSKDSLPVILKYGSHILIHKRPQPIKNSGNPGSFDYKRFLSFQQVYHQVFLKKEEWTHLPSKSETTLQGFLFSAREGILKVLKKYISDDQVAIAEALLIGYKEDLDKELMQAYSNTGVVHIIAISGLHLGLIFFMLTWILKRIPLIKNSTHTKAVLLISSLWMFSLLTGGAASVLRSAVMFTSIVIGQSYFKRTSIYNSLCSSAFILLCYNPYFLWDVGFQLSYLAIIGIVAIQQPMYRMLFIKNLLVNKVWQMACVTIAAQMLTFPVCLYYFHQFPTMFLLTNLIAVPLSTLILFCEILLMFFLWIPYAGILMGKIISLLILLMNRFILFFNDLPFSKIDNIYSDIATTCLLYIMILFFSMWMIYKNKLLLKISLIATLLFTVRNVYSKGKVQYQKKIVVYNIPRYTAIDFISRSDYFFYGDSMPQENTMLRNFHLKPSRIALKLKNKKDTLKELLYKGGLWKLSKTNFMIVDSKIKVEPLLRKIHVDALLISKNPIIDFPLLLSAIEPSVVVFDASNSLWKIAQWKKECERLLLPCHSVPEKGAFILNVD